jgi:hypothetical protein
VNTVESVYVIVLRVQNGEEGLAREDLVGGWELMLTREAADYYWSQKETLTILLKRDREVTRGDLKSLAKGPETT